VGINILLSQRSSIKKIKGISDSQIKFFEIKQIQTANRLLWFTQPFNIANSFLMNFIFFHEFNNLLANSLTAIITITAIAWLTSANYFFPASTETNTKMLGWKTHCCFSIVMSSAFITFCAYAFTNVSGEEQLLITGIITGMIAGGAIALSTLPYVVIAWVLPFTIGTFIFSDSLNNSVIGLILSGMVVILSTLMLLAIFLVHRRSILHIAAQVNALNHQNKAEKQSETIGLLLRDFEDQVNDWLWELDSNNCIAHVPDKIIKMSGLNPRKLQKIDLLNLFSNVFRSSSEDQAAPLKKLQHHLATKVAFSDIIIPARLNTECWLKLSAKPLFDDEDNFIGWRGLSSDVTASFLNTRHIEHLANFDPLTGLANRYHFNQAIVRFCEQKTPFTLVLLDLDNFKYVNDTFGHAEGDQLLQKVANRMQQSIADSDLLCRLGGDEFAIISHQLDHIENTCKRLLVELRLPIELANVNIEVSASIGISQYPKDAVNDKELLKKADIAMYNAKSSATDSILLFSAEMERRNYERSEMVLQLRKAIQEKELSLVYQPQISVKTQKIVGFEALMRWNNNAMGNVSPETFIPLAEESGLIVDMGYWALETACNQALLWGEDIPVSVNVSGLQLLSAGFEKRVISILRITGLSPPRLHLEVTESSIVSKIEQANLILTRLQAIGVKISLDDFGTGFSSLSYLQKLSIDTLKIDRSFIQGLDKQDELESSIAIIDIIFKLAEVLSLKVMVEGVESEFHLQQLVALGCENIQGYLFSPPINEASVKQYIQQFIYVN
jgi:diguanylate cyclase (GGDEF)-like protein